MPSQQVARLEHQLKQQLHSRESLAKYMDNHFTDTAREEIIAQIRYIEGRQREYSQKKKQRIQSYNESRDDRERARLETGIKSADEHLQTAKHNHRQAENRLHTYDQKYREHRAKLDDINHNISRTSRSLAEARNRG